MTGQNRIILESTGETTLLLICGLAWLTPLEVGLHLHVFQLHVSCMTLHPTQMSIFIEPIRTTVPGPDHIVRPG